MLGLIKSQVQVSATILDMALSGDKKRITQQAPACDACSRAKRRCGREHPSCRRCRVRHVPCVYPARVVLSRTSLSSSTDEPAVVPYQSPQSLSHQAPSPANEGRVDTTQHHVAAPWFLEPSSWDVEHGAIPEDDRITYPSSGLDFFFEKMKIWLDQWALDNHCPFIHPRLYGSDLPTALHYALGAWNTYRSYTTETNRKIALHMARNWSLSLVENQRISDRFEDSTMDLIAQLGRIQALLILEFICLFDGDIRSRAHGETLLPTLISWVLTLVQKAKESVSSHGPLDPEGLLNQPAITQLRSDGTVASSWRAWILSESIRRTWVVTGLTDAAYWILKDNFCLCPGSIAFTVRTGVWEAASPTEWITALRSNSTTAIPTYCRRFDILLRQAKPEDVDELGQTLLAYGSGQEALDDWLAS